MIAFDRFWSLTSDDKISIDSGTWYVACIIEFLLDECSKPRLWPIICVATNRKLKLEESSLYLYIGKIN